MARRRKGRDISGWIAIDKPAGITSTAVVNKVRWAFNAKKAGHAGTLDPEATGILAIALGEATKTVPYITDALKAYRFAVSWGSATDTDDAEGRQIATSAKRPTEAEIKAALGQFVGDIQQVPPAYSAVKIDGERAYKKARDGEELTLAARPLWVEELLLTGCSSPDEAELELVCGKGGYVRAIARDLGADLGCLGHVKWLRRIWSGPFDESTSVSLDQIEALARTPELDELLQPLELGLETLPEARCLEPSVMRLKNGNPAPVICDADYGEEIWASHNGRALAVGIYRGGELHPTRVFNQPDDQA